MKRAALVAVCVAMLASGQVLAAELPGRVTVGSTDATGFPTIKTSVVVADAVGLPITGLKEADFAVIEDGKTVAVTGVQTLTNLAADMTAVLVLDTSGSMAGAPLTDAVAAVNGFIDQVGADAQVGAVSLGGQCVVDAGPGLTRDKGVAREFIDGAEAGGDTPLYDATLTAVQQTLAAAPGRRMVIVLTDGEDTCSKVSFDTLVNAALHNGVPLTIIGLGPDIRADILQNLANLTGGQFIAAEDSSKLGAIYSTLTTRLRTQYGLQFRSGQYADRHEHTYVVHVKTGGVEIAGESRYTTPAIGAKPRVGLTAGQKISSATPIEISNESPVPLVKAEVYLDETLLESVSGSGSTPLSYTLDPSGLSGGNHTVRVHVWDSAGGEADATVGVELVETGVFGRIPYWAILGLVLLLPLVAVVGIVVVNGRRRGLRCAKCHRPLEVGWAACPYCSRPEPAPVAQMPAGPRLAPIPEGPAAPPPAPLIFTSVGSSNGHAGGGDTQQSGADTLVGHRPQPQPIGATSATQMLNVGQVPGAWLIISAGDQIGTRFRVGAEDTTIGRDGDSDVVLDDVGASRQHARIRRTAGGYQLTDLDTTNGTRLNGKPIHREILRQGDIIEIGTTRLNFVTVPEPKGS